MIGFDRRIRLEWLDDVAQWASEGLSLDSIRERIYQLLERPGLRCVEDGALRKDFSRFSGMFG